MNVEINGTNKCYAKPGLQEDRVFVRLGACLRETWVVSLCLALLGFLKMEGVEPNDFAAECNLE